MRIKLILLAVPTVILTLLAFNFGFISSRPRQTVNKLIISSIGDASFLNPVLAQDSASADIVSFVFNGLLKYDENLQLTGDLAQSWVVEKGPKPRITFHLRKGVHWHDGVEFTAKDVNFTYQTIMDPRTNTVRRSDFELVEKVEVLDRYTVRVTYREPFSPGLETWTIGIIPKHILEGQDINTSPFNRHPIGTGPFRVVEWVSDEKIVLEANPDYFEGRPYLDGIIYRIIPETSLSEIELLTGGVDYMGIYPHQYQRMTRDPGLRVYSQLALGYTYIGYNLENELFRDPRVRRALTHAIDREAILKYVLYGRGEVATGPFPPQMWYYNPQVKPLPYNPELARRLLKEAGWGDTDGDGVLDKNGKPFRFVLITNSGNDIRRDVGVMVQRYWREVGIDVKLGLYEWSVFLKNFINPRHFEACILGWSLSVDPDAYSIWHSKQVYEGFNFISYQNHRVDSLLVAGRREYELEKRRKIYYEIHRLINEDQPYTFLFVPEATPALRHRFVQVVSSNGRKTFAEIEMTKAGLLYHLIRWYAPRRPELAL